MDTSFFEYGKVFVISKTFVENRKMLSYTLIKVSYTYRKEIYRND